MANVTITQLPAAGPITGTELVPIVQNGQTVQTTAAAIAASPSQFQTFLTLNQEPTLPASRALSGGTGIGLVDGGALSTLQITLNGVSGTLESSGPGMLAKVGGTVVPRALVASGSGLSVTDGNGIAGNPTIALTGALAALAGISGSGIISLVNTNSVSLAEILGTVNQITVVNGLGAGNPTISISTDPVIPGTGAMTVPKGTTAQRPGGVDGMLRFNTDTDAFEIYDSGGWNSLPAGAITLINTGTGLTGGPITSSGTISMANTTVASGNYGAADSVATFTVNSQGQLTAAATVPIAITTGQITGSIAIAQGGTGLSTYAAGDMVYYTTGTAFTKLGIGASTYMMTSSGTAPQWTDPASITVGNATTAGSATTAVTATNIAGGGVGQLPYNTGFGTTSFLPRDVQGYILVEGIVNPQWENPANITVGNATNAVTATDTTNILGGATGSIVYNSALSTTTFLPLGTSTFLLRAGASAPEYVDPATVTVGTATSATSATNVAGGAIGQLVYNTAPSTSTFLPLGTLGHFLLAGATAPQYVDPSTLTVGNATTATSAVSSSNLDGGAAGSVPYQTALGVTAMLPTASGVLVGGTTPSYSTAPTLTGTNFSSIPNAALDNSSLTIGTTAISLGSSSLTLGGLTSVAVTQDPSTALELATKQYVDGLVVSAVHFHQPVRAESPTPLNATYNNGVSGVGATLTNAGTQVALVIDGVTLSVSDRVLVYTQTNQTENGIYVVSNVGSISTNWVLTRASDADTFQLASPNGLSEGSTVFVQEGATGAGETYTCNTTGTIVFGTTNITFAQISSAQVYSAGTGLTLSGTQFSLNSPVATSLGGTGLTTYTTGDLLYYATGSALSKLGIGTSTFILTSSGTAPTWSDPSGVTVGTATNATNASTATNVANGSAGGIVYNTANSVTTFLALGSTNHILVAGATAPQYVDPSTVTVGSATTATTAGSATTATTATNVAGGAANEIVYNTAASTTSFIGAPSSPNTYLGWNGSAFVWGSVSATSATNLSGGTAGALPYQTGVGATGFLSLGTTTYLLRAGASAPEYVDPSTVTVGSATNAVTASSATTATTATNVAGGGTGQIVYNTASGTTTFLALGSTNFLLRAGASAPQYVDPATVSVGSATTATTATTATNATNVATTATSTNANFFIPFVAASTTSNQALGVDAGITYNPSTNAITAGIAGGTF